MKIYFCIAGNNQFVFPDSFILYKGKWDAKCSKIFSINIVPTAVKSPRADVPMMGMNFSVIKNVEFQFTLINEIEEGSELYNTILKEMEKLELKNN